MTALSASPAATAAGSTCRARRTDQSFDARRVPPAAGSGDAKAARQVPLPGGRQMLLASLGSRCRAGSVYLIETGAPMDGVQAELKHWLLFLATCCRWCWRLRWAAGFILVKRALLPVDHIAASAQRISSQNLSERLPVAQTGDELERLSVALNRMIERLDAPFNTRDGSWRMPPTNCARR